MMHCPNCESVIDIYEVNCANCNNLFMGIRKRGRPRIYCSPACKDAAAAARHNVPKVTRLKAV